MLGLLRHNTSACDPAVHRMQVGDKFMLKNSDVRTSEKKETEKQNALPIIKT